MRHACRFMLMLGLFTGAMAQDSLSLGFRQDNLSTNSEIRHNWRIPLSVGLVQTDNQFRYKQFNSKTAQEQEYSLEDKFNLKYQRPLSERFNTGLRLEYNLFSDRRTGLGSDLSNSALLATLGSRTQKFKTNEIALGLRTSQRYGLSETGPTASVDLGKRWDNAGQVLNAGLEADADLFDVNENLQVNALLAYRADFNRRAYFQSGINRRERQQEFFTDSLRSSQSRQILDIRWQNKFAYRLNPSLEIFHRLDYIEQATSIERWKEVEGEREPSSDEDRSNIGLLNESGLALNSDHMQGSLAFRVDNTQRKYYVDYNQVFYQLNGNLAVQPTAWIDSLRWTSILARQKHDTPDTTNDDDRDEFRFSNSLTMSWLPNPFVRVAVGMKLNLFHMVYLFNTRSAENHWNRSLIFWNRVSWRRGPWASQTSGRVHANYFDYDYDELFVEMGQALRSFVHRSLELEESINYRLSPSWSIAGHVDLRWEDDGRLSWKDFVQEVQSDRTQQEWMLQSLHSYRAWEFWYGYLLHEREKAYTDPNRESETWTGRGPLLGWRRTYSSRFQFSADMRFIQVEDQENSYLLPKVSINASWLP